MNYKDNIEWLKSLKQQIGQAQHSDLWHFEQAIDETIDNLRPLTEPHGRLIDADKFLKDNADFADRDFIHPSSEVTLRELIDGAPTIIEAEVSELSQ